MRDSQERGRSRWELSASNSHNGLMTPWSLWEQTGGLYQEDLVCCQESCNPRELHCEQEIQMLNSQHWELRGFHRYKPECPQAISEASHQGVQVGVGALSHALGYS